MSWDTAIYPFVALLSTFILAIVAVFAPRAFEKWKHTYYFPKLDFEFKFQAPYCCLTQMRDHEIRFPVYYFRFAVVNNGKTQANDCEAVLEKVWTADISGILHPWRNFLDVSLKWVSGDSPMGRLKTIYPDRRVACNIGRIHHPEYEPESAYMQISEDQKRRNKFFFEAVELPYSQWDCLLPGTYEIEISVYSKNALKISRRFRISWSGEWKDTEASMFEEIKISEIGGSK